MDGLEFTCEGVSQPRRIAGSPVTPDKPVWVVTLRVANRKLLLPARWGWRYLTAELVDAGGGVAIRAYPAIHDAATDAGWSGDLAPGASVRAQFLFYPSSGKLTPGEFRLTMNDTGRGVAIRLR
ncbi:MAG: hypothetical protein FJW31_18400 [Acidobacteria bacterium]|nr:hypothetical protein [Acidobacteriota bacterium]